MDDHHEQHRVHVVVYQGIWCPKRRRTILHGGPLHDRLLALLPAVAAARHWQVLRLAMQPDAVPLCLRANPYTLPTDLPRVLKGRRARLLRDAFPALQRLPARWTRSSCSSTAGQVISARIHRSLEAQRRP